MTSKPMDFASMSPSVVQKMDRPSSCSMASPDFGAAGRPTYQCWPHKVSGHRARFTRVRHLRKAQACPRLCPESFGSRCGLYSRCTGASQGPCGGPRLGRRTGLGRGATPPKPSGPSGGHQLPTRRCAANISVSGPAASPEKLVHPLFPDALSPTMDQQCMESQSPVHHHDSIGLARNLYPCVTGGSPGRLVESWRRSKHDSLVSGGTATPTKRRTTNFSSHTAVVGRRRPVSGHATH